MTWHVGDWTHSGRGIGVSVGVACEVGNYNKWKLGVTPMASCRHKGTTPHSTACTWACDISSCCYQVDMYGNMSVSACHLTLLQLCRQSWRYNSDLLVGTVSGN